MQNCKVNILGTEYSLIFKCDEKVCKDMNVEIGDCGGYCNSYSHEIVVAILDTCIDKESAKEELRKANLRHEIIHAFFNESGLGFNANSSDCWAKNEEMVDWFAIQSPKIFKVFKELDLL